MPGASSPIRRGFLKLVLSLREVVDLGPSTSVAIVANTLRTEARRRQDDRAEAGSATTRAPGRLSGVEVLGGADADGSGPVVGARCLFSEAELEVVFVGEDLVRLSWGPADPPVPWAIDRSASLGTPTVTVSAEASGCTLESAALRVVVGPAGAVSYFDGAGVLLRHELPPLRRGAARTARHLLRPGERVSGLGEQAGPVDLRGTTHRLWNRDPGGAWGPGQDPLYCSIPVMVGLHPEGDVLSFYENTYDAVVRVDASTARLGASAAVELTFSGGMLRHYVAIGPLPGLLDRYSGLTGRPPLPPRWALGYHQCKWGYKNEAQIREVADGFAAEGVPLSAVHLDIDYMDGYRVFSVDRQAFPDLLGLSGDLIGRGTRIVTIVDPAVKDDPGYDVFAEGVTEGRFLLDEDDEPLRGVVWPGPAVFPDFTDPATRRWWSGLYPRLLDQGVAGIWHDMNEPTSITLWGDRTLPKSTRHSVEGRGGDHRECHNAYGSLMNEAGWDALVAHDPARRPFILSRAGWAGLQRHAWNWTADIEASWEGLGQQIATTIGLGLSGVPYTGSDIGGFSGVPTPELYVRWLELSVLMPFCRTHCVLGSPPREPWRFPEPHRGAIDRLIRFRYRLLPYLYLLAHEAAEHGTPLVRPLCWPEPGTHGSSLDDRLWQVNDAYMLGDSLLIAPVTAEGMRSRMVVLPAGRWYRWRATGAMPEQGEGPVERSHSDSHGASDEVTAIEGGRSVRVDAPAGQPVLFVRAGSVLALDDGFLEAALGDRGHLSTGHEPRLFALHCFPNADGTAAGRSYDDAGDGYGEHRLDRFALTTSGVGGALFSWERSGEYPAPGRMSVVFHGLEATGAIADGTEVDAIVTRRAGAEPATRFECPPFAELVLGGVGPSSESIS
jgi:alpha-glucosidase